HNGEDLLVDQVLDPRADDPHVLKAQIVDDVAQPFDPALHALDEDEGRVRTCQCPRDAGETRTGADVAHDIALVQQRGGHAAVEDVPGPQPRQLARADEAPLDTGGRQVLRVALRQLQAVTEDFLGKCGALLELPIDLLARGGLPVLRSLDRVRRAHAGCTTTWRRSPSPSDSDRMPACATTSWTTLRSKLFIARSATGSPPVRTSSIAFSATRRRSSLRRLRKPSTSSM